MEQSQKVKKLETIAIVVLAAATLLGGIVFGIITAQVKNFAGIDNLRKFQVSMPTKILDVHGELIAELFQEKRELVAFEDLPNNLIVAFLATEDKEFFSHIGLNPMAIVRAMGRNILAGKIKQGGSTITQQLAKRLFTTGERTFTRKALEAILALQIEKRFTKEEILEMYFNQIYLGHGCYGIATAADFFFNKKAQHLNIDESSVLAALPSAPGRYSPLKNTRNAFRKNWDILSRIVEQGYLTTERAGQIYREFWPRYVEMTKLDSPSRTVYTKSIDRAPYFTDYIRQIMITRYGEDAVYNDGLTVYSTLDLRRNTIGEKVLRSGLDQQRAMSDRSHATFDYYHSAVDMSLFSAYNTLRMIFNLPAMQTKADDVTQVKRTLAENIMDELDILSLLVNAGGTSKFIENFREVVLGISTLKVEGALIAVEPQTGYITTMIGGHTFTVDNQFNRAMQARRQPGSSFKPFVYGAAIEGEYVSDRSVLPDAPIVEIDSEGVGWSPTNYEGDFKGLVDVRRAVAASINIIAVRVFDLVGPDNVIDFAAKMLKVPPSRFDPNPTLALGTTEVTPFEMATAYAIFANKGREVIPFAIRYVIDKDGNEVMNVEEEVGNIIAAKERDGTVQVISEQTAWLVNDLMRGVIDGGTGNEPIRYKAGFLKQAAGKTGTTTNWSDSWFCGLTPDIAAIVWVGYDKATMTLGAGAAGAMVAAPIWGRYMKDVYNGMPDPAFPKEPSGVFHGAIGPYSDFKGSKMKSVLERYMEREGISLDENQ
ncbi:MAG TPA: PBP1A family penicillin-binding protein [Spirochaetota bacterium]|nr:PBP1A family penicillin-binding protein [Spirochaetota bacterium]HNT09344.1 PBP1A family penicillin-binding protein [Spirochaetota bacterium]